MILYFSGTGNSRYVAEMIGKNIGDEVASMNTLIKNRSKEVLNSEKPFVFVAPTYAWRMPLIVEDFIKEGKFKGNKKAYFILTCGESIGNAQKYAKDICEVNGLSFQGLTSIEMVSNYIIMYDVVDENRRNEIIKKAEPKILEISKMIKDEKPLPENKISLGGKAQSGPINKLFYGVYVSAKGFYSTDSCTGCGKCAKLCPLNNIRIEDKKPQWGKDCTHCTACISACPHRAIEYKNGTKKRSRYYNNLKVNM